ncbi:MAG TPA: hypothetical protein EYN06_03945 [Myxococcales bacterium]|nr:hypothetical protein [Myxococcales bacterium]
MKALVTISLLTLVMVSACSKSETPVKTVVTNPQGPPPTGINHPPVELPPDSREVKRMTIEMLRNSVDLIVGTDEQGKQIRWTHKVGNKTFDMLSDSGLAKTLGKPDYMNTTEEPAKPTALYLKFMDDMSRDLCGKVLVADSQKSVQATRTLIRFIGLKEYQDANAIHENLRYLKLRFHGEQVPDTDTETLAPLKKVFDTVAAAEKSEPAAEAWRAVCVALFLSPEFHLY